VPEPPESEAIEPRLEAPPEPVAQAEPVTQPEPSVQTSEFHYLKRWTTVAVFLAVWIPAAAIGLGLYYWWFHSLDKTFPVFIVLVFVIGCTVASLLLAMGAHRPLVAAVAIAVITAPAAAVLGAAPLHGTYYCEKSITPVRCLFGVLPY
jgi:hypothetical protein